MIGYQPSQSSSRRSAFELVYPWEFNKSRANDSNLLGKLKEFEDKHFHRLISLLALRREQSEVPCTVTVDLKGMNHALLHSSASFALPDETEALRTCVFSFFSRPNQGLFYNHAC